jgi:hypothetical protein
VIPLLLNGLTFEGIILEVFGWLTNGDKAEKFFKKAFSRNKKNSRK